MKRTPTGLLALAVAAVAVGVAVQFSHRPSPGRLHGLAAPPRAEQGPNPGLVADASGGDQLMANAFEHHERDVVVEDRGTVARVLADDRSGSRHQRFIVRLASGQTILIAYNIDIARRIEGLAAGDTIEFKGEYEWNAAGGVVHWTHADPAGRHPGGWIKYRGETYR